MPSYRISFTFIYSLEMKYNECPIVRDLKINLFGLFFFDTRLTLLWFATKSLSKVAEGVCDGQDRYTGKRDRNGHLQLTVLFSCPVYGL